jgi:hypothetical protein
MNCGNMVLISKNIVSLTKKASGYSLSMIAPCIIMKMNEALHAQIKIRASGRSVEMDDKSY